jgi:putative phosphoesterase
MRKIGLISDTHDYLDDAVFKHFDRCDEIWHAGDFGTIPIAEALRNFKPLKGVYGNIDGPDIRTAYPETEVWNCEEVKILMIHIGGYPPKYNTVSKKLLQQHRPKLFISGHSHILKIMFDDNLQCLHINPGAAGRQGWHTVRTLVRFSIDGKDIRDCEVIELGSRLRG